MKYRIDSLKIQELVDKVNGRINSELASEIALIKELGNNVEWKGASRDAAISRYNELTKEIIDLEETLSMYMKFLEIVVEKYGEGLDEIRNSILDVVDQIKLENGTYEL